MGRIEHLDTSAFEAHLRTNVVGVLVGIKQALAHRNPDQPLRIVNISSGAATRAYRGWGAYCSSKAAVNLLGEVAAAEAPDNVSVLSVAPGVIETRMQRTIRNTDPSRFPEVKKFLDLHQKGELIHPIDAATTLVWLLRKAPLSLSGHFLDARSEELKSRIEATQETIITRAKAFFDALESQA
jgi:NAD(P)-dependent dehydrogenase (short-subunit alcohol dehydrogenase family)